MEILIIFGTYLVYISLKSGLNVLFVEILIMFGTYLVYISLKSSYMCYRFFFLMDAFTINFHHGRKFIQNGATWTYVGGNIGYLDLLSLDTFSYFKGERDMKIIYVSIRRIVYLKPYLGFNEDNTFFNDDNGCWEMLKLVREDKI